MVCSENSCLYQQDCGGQLNGNVIKSDYDEIGYALHCAQMGNTYSSTKMFKGYGSGVYEIVSDFNTDAYRAVYIVNLGNSPGCG
jgi:hypothetical protein